MVYALVNAKTTQKQIDAFRGLGLRIVDEKFKDQLDAKDIYKPKAKKTK
jgi:hypothetical protein